VAKVRQERGAKPVSQTQSVLVKPYKKESIGSIANRVVMDYALRKQKRMEAEAPEVLSWEDCIYCKKDSNKIFCKKFFSLCAKEKCPKNLRG
jgi:hypothetical protein